MPFSFASPEELDALQRSLDRAWALVNERHSFDPLAASGARERLAYIVAALWQRGIINGNAEQAAEEFDATAPETTLPSKPTRGLKRPKVER